MGTLFGAKLSPHTDVTLFGRWPEQIYALQHAPLHMVYPDGHEEFIPLRATDNLKNADPIDIALILPKANKTALAAEDAAQILKPAGVAITLQNGVGNLEIIAGVVGAQRATLGVTMQGASTDGLPGYLRYGGRGLTYLATRPEIDASIQALAGLFTLAGLATEVVADVAGLVWGKLVVNAGINPLTAILRVPNGALLESEWARQMMREAANEVAVVAHAKGIILSHEDAASRVEEVASRTAVNHSSMLQDVLRGTPTEIEAISGAVVREGAKLGIPTPVNQMLYRMVRAVEDLRLSHPQATLPALEQIG
ncbi:MAG: 2-dehydropantoate 2-reductase [Chloroflexi bacterium]|nr:2-dehydropantoate 2-reductase [Chloroflexota bacterium]